MQRPNPQHPNPQRPILQRLIPWANALFVLAAASLAFLVSDYRLFQLSLVVVYAVAVLGLGLVTGFNGQISLGHGAFYAVGAYTTAILMSLYEVP